MAVRETLAGDRVVRGAVRQETEPCGGWAVRGPPRHEPNRGGSVRSMRTAAVCGTVVNTNFDNFCAIGAYDGRILAAVPLSAFFPASAAPSFCV